MANSYNNKYRIALYDVPDSIKNLIQQSDKFPSNLFDITTVLDLSKRGRILDQPDVILIPYGMLIDHELEEYAAENCIQIAYITNESLTKDGRLDYKKQNDEELFMSTSPSPLITENIYGDKKIITEQEEGLRTLKNMVQVANASKLAINLKKGFTNIREKEREKGPTEDVTLNTLLKLSKIIKNKDNYTKMHSDHVSHYAVLLGKYLNLSDEEIKIIEVGGELHDIGKIGIPDEIIRKESGLTDYEYEIMKSHTTIGAELLSQTEYPEIKDMIKYHHEKFDGHGYPDGLKGEEIPLFARILAVADTYDAMTTQRTYNHPRTMEEAFQELKRSSTPSPNRYGEMSQQLDPNLVDIFINGILNDKDELQRQRMNDINIYAKRADDAIKEQQNAQGRSL